MRKIKVLFEAIVCYLKSVRMGVKHADYSSAFESAEIMNDFELMALLQQSIREADDGNLLKWEDVKLLL
jgi:hypothetical protein